MVSMRFVTPEPGWCRWHYCHIKAPILCGLSPLSYFYKHETVVSVHREGTGWMWRMMDGMVRGEAEIRKIETWNRLPAR